MTTDHHKRILVVDDDGDTRKILKAVLSQRGLSVDEAVDGEAAIELLRENQYAVILLDIFMPRIDGFQVLQTLHGDGAQAPPVVLVVTGADRPTIEKLDSRYIHGVVRKPFDPEDVASLVVACSEIKSRGAFGTMALATVLSGAQMLHWLVNK
jgi:two-component system chemotaxis response regulator CheY